MPSSGQAAEVTTKHDALRGRVLINLDNRASLQAAAFLIADNAYYKNGPQQVRVAAGRQKTIEWKLSSGWFDASIRLVGDVAWFRRIAGCVQHALRNLTTDPAIGNSQLFAPQFSIDGAAFAELRFDYAVPPWLHRPRNWIGVYARGASPSRANLLQWVYAPRGVGSVLLSASGKAALPPGQYDAWYFFDDMYTTLGTKPVPFTLA